MGLPPLTVPDLVVHPRDNDLVIATHARGYYILDDVTPLQKLARARAEGVTLFPPPPCFRYIPASDTSTIGDQVFAAPNKPYGSIISYHLPESAAGGEVKIEILDASGKLLRALTGPAKAGINRVVWDLVEDPRFLLKTVRDEPGFRLQVQGIRVLPGRYRVRMTAAGRTLEQPFEVKLDPRSRPAAAAPSALRRRSLVVGPLGFSRGHAVRFVLSLTLSHGYGYGLRVTPRIWPVRRYRDCGR